jgi:hypothetical protein
MHTSSQKPVFLFSLATLIFAAAGILLREAELTSVFEADTGLTAFSPLTVALILVSCLAVVFYAVFSRKTDLSHIPGDYVSAFRPSTPFPLAVSIFTLLIMLAGAYLCYFFGLLNITSAAAYVLALLAALSGAAGFILSLSAFRKKGRSNIMLPAVADVVFLCFWTVIYYRQQAANPVLIDGMYAFLGLCASTLAFFYITAFTAGRPAPASTLLFSGIGIYFCIIAILNTSVTAYGLFFAVLAIRLYVCSVLLLRSSKPENSENQG